MNSTPSISVILPVYNGEKYLRASIESVLDQDYEDFELIIWNDHASDGSAEIIASYQDQRVRSYMSPSNQGLFKTLNLSIGKSKGDWIRIWSQDDVMKPHCLKTELAFHELMPNLGMGYCAYDLIDDKGVVIRPAPTDLTPEAISPDLAALIMFYHGSITANIANVMLKRAVLNHVGLFREDMKIAGDFEMWVRISTHYPIGFVHEPLIYLRSHSEQFSQQRNSYVTCIGEERPIYESLLKRLPSTDVAYAREYDRRTRHLQYVHHMIYCLLRGWFRPAARAYREISRIGHPLLLLAWWFLTVDRRFFRMESKYAPHQFSPIAKPSRAQPTP